jgi:hypothetical protein
VPENLSRVLFRVASSDRVTHRGNRCGNALTTAELRKSARPVRNGNQQDAAWDPVPPKRSYLRGLLAADRAGGSLPRETYWRQQP